MKHSLVRVIVIIAAMIGLRLSGRGSLEKETHGLCSLRSSWDLSSDSLLGDQPG